jgi:ATP-dependent RNA helicase SUPV3L1/SUV3
MGRKVVCHVGPTNSGKTHNALAALEKANSGVYCGPLRLLAWEVYEKMNSKYRTYLLPAIATSYVSFLYRGLPCRLLTGQELQGPQLARHTSCTVEMAHLGMVYEVAVLDEAQLMADSTRYT